MLARVASIGISYLFMMTEPTTENLGALTSGIVPLDPRRQDHLEAAAFLHEKLLGDSLVAQLGRLFMKKFYYCKLVESGLVRCDLFRCDGGYVALSAYTKYPYTFMARGQRRFFLFLAGTVSLGVIAKPSRVSAILKVMSQNRKRSDRTDDGKTGEYLSLGVLPAYLDWKDEKTGSRISDLLYERAMDYFKENHCREVLLVIQKSNKLAVRFHQNRGAVLKDGDYVPPACCLMSVALHSR